jgi:D-alanyl-D-alanine carboxypeptidase
MSHFPDPIKSTDLIVYTPPISVEGQKHAYLEKMHNLFMKRSFKEQVTDCQHFSDSWYDVETRSVVADLEKRMKPTIPEGAGASVLVCANGEKPRHLGLGRTSVQDGHAIDENTAAVIGSGAKMFTGLASKILENQGILSLKTKLSEVMEERHFTIFQDPEAAKDITLEMLLSHTSGLQFHAEISRNEREGMTLDAILDAMCKEAAKDPRKKIQLTGTPGDGIYAYSNQISLAAVFIEKAYNRAHQAAHPESSERFTYADILRREVFEPLGMSRTSFVKPEENVMRAYRDDGGIPQSEDADIRDPMHQPAGGLWSTAADIGKLAQAFAKAFKSGEGLKSADGRRVLLSPESLDDFLSPRGVSGVTAVGIDVVGPFFGKGGEISTYDFKFSFDRETGSYIVSLCNFKNSSKFGGEIADGRKPGYINHVIPTLDEMHARFSVSKTSTLTVEGAQEISEPLESLPLHSCNLFFYGGMGIIGMDSKNPKWLNWNGEILPMKQIGKNKFLITGEGPHADKVVRFGNGGKGNPYVFIETIPKTEKVITPIAFKAVQPGPWMVDSAESNKISEIETLKLQKNLPLGEILDAQGTYISTRGAEGASPITVIIDEEAGVIKVKSEERTDAEGAPLEISMTVSSSKQDSNGHLNELWLIGNFMRVPLYQLKLSKQESGKWMLEVLDFSSKDSVDKMLPEVV